MSLRIKVDSMVAIAIHGASPRSVLAFTRSRGRAYKNRQRQKFFSLKKVFCAWEKPSTHALLWAIMDRGFHGLRQEPMNPAAHALSRDAGCVSLRTEQ